MKSVKKSFLSLMLVAAFVGGARAATLIGEPSVGATIVPRSVAKSDGLVFANGNSDVGYKVWIATDTNPHQITDENGTVVTSGLINSVCMSSGTVAEWGVVYDSATVGALTIANSNAAASVLAQVTETTQRVAATHTCQKYDSQFNNGAVVLQSGNTGGGTVMVFWRPGRGGSN